MTWYDDLSWKERLRVQWSWKWNEWDDFVCDRPKLSTQDWLYSDPYRGLFCRIFGHQPTPDQCLIPAHDYCVTCNTRTPNQASR